MARLRIKDILKTTPENQQIIVKGWVRTFRNNSFIALNDGSTNNNLQVVVDFNNVPEETLKRITTGAAVQATGILIPSLGKGQTVEVKADSVEIIGDSDAEKYPLQPKKHSLEFLREIAHLRFRTNTFGAVFRVRNSLAFAIHKFFNEKGFLYIHTPIITSSDAEGAGEMFRVTTLDINRVPYTSERISKVCTKYTDSIFGSIEDKYKDEILQIDIELKNYDKELTFKKFIQLDLSAIDELVKKEILKNEKLTTLIKKIYTSLEDSHFYEKKDGKTYLPSWLVASINSARKDIRADYKIWPEETLCLNFYNFNFIQNSLRVSNDRKTDYSQDFFGKSTNLTVSGQLEGELAAMAFSDIYTFGPTFRAENSNTARHLAEFWMIEPEMAFCDLQDNMNMAEEMLQYVIRYALENNREDIEFLSQRLEEEEKQKPQNERSEMTLLQKLQFCLDNKFERVTYTQAIEILRESNHNKKKKFQYLVNEWGVDLQSEHERYLVEKHFKKPVILIDYPKEIKSFYMRLNDDGKTVAAMDILFPGIGEIVGGSQREERLDKLETRMSEIGIPKEELEWYLDTRRFGSNPHAGFGLGFERLVLFVTGMTNIRDVIPFPRTPKNCEF